MPAAAVTVGLRCGVMGNMVLNHLGGGAAGIEHFFQQFAGPMTAWWKTLGAPVFAPEVQTKLIDSVRAEVGSCAIEDLEAARDEMLLGLIKLHSRRLALFKLKELESKRPEDPAEKTPRRVCSPRLVSDESGMVPSAIGLPLAMQARK